MNNIFIGTSNVTMPGNKQSFPKKFRNGSRLHYYSSLFRSVEINSSFYKTPLYSTFNKWQLDTFPDFWFSVKLTRDITHAKNLGGELTGIQKFLEAANGLQDKKGCLLVQFPGKITLAYYSKVEQILEAIAAADYSNDWNIAVEFRHAGWYVGETMELMDEYNASLVLHDIPRSANTTLNKKAGFVYYRFHGPTGNYRDSYDKKFLEEAAISIQQFAKKGKPVYAYFNNTIGNAYENALLLQQLTGKNKRNK